MDEELEEQLDICRLTDFSESSDEHMSVNQYIPANYRFLRRFRSRDLLGLLLVSLLKIVCCFLEPNPDRQRLLFYVVSSFLTEVGIIPNYLLSNNSYSIRQRFLLALVHLLKAAQDIFKIQIAPELAELIPPLSASNDENTLAPYICNEAERYNRGRWGTQYNDLKSHWKESQEKDAWDSDFYNGNQFTVKKMVFTTADAATCSKELREVRILSKLEHPNIIRYYGGWVDFEDFVDKSHFCENWSSELNIHELGRSCNSFINSGSTPFRRSKSCPEIISVAAAAQTESNCHCANASSFEENLSGTICHTRYIPKLAYTQRFLCVYIRMEHWSLTLQDWLSARNLRTQRLNDRFSVISPHQNEEMLMQLIEALQYIHRQGVIHCNIQPSNIFLKGRRPHLLVGGFGQACCANELSNFESWTFPHSWSVRSGSVDTNLYVAPELLEKDAYDSTVDIFSVGIIMMELYCPYRTQAERIESINQLRRSQIPEDFYRRWPVIACVGAQAVDQQPTKRPSAKSLLATGLFHSNSKDVMQLKEEVSALERERFEVLSRLDKCTCARAKDL
uniref:Eukaryotic translation initiation factor 2-alpha kinase 1 n=1 Tax=Trichuris muris TaxID=70415 RepID=A0A5S6QV28_TRIMR